MLTAFRSAQKDCGNAKYNGLLEKKWTSVIRLQKKVCLHGYQYMYRNRTPGVCVSGVRTGSDVHCTLYGSVSVLSAEMFGQNILIIHELVDPGTLYLCMCNQSTACPTTSIVSYHDRTLSPSCERKS